MSRRLRKSLLPRTTLKEDLLKSSQESPWDFTSNGETTDDCEWECLQQKIANDKIMNEIAQKEIEEYIESDESDEDYVWPTNLDECIAAKEEELNTVQRQTEDIALRFVWDLCFAMKRKFIAMYGNTQYAANLVNVGIRDVIGKMYDDQPPPDDWKNWIENQFFLKCGIYE